MNKKGYTRIFLIVMILIFISILIIWTDSNLDFWATHIKEKPTDVPIWVSIIAVAGNVITVAGNVIMEIAKFFV